MQEQEDATAGLVADAGYLFIIRGLRQQDLCVPRARRSYEDLALVAALAVFRWRIFDEFEAKTLREEGDGFVIVTDDQSNMADSLMHGCSVLQDAGQAVLATAGWDRRYLARDWIAFSVSCA